MKIATQVAFLVKHYIVMLEALNAIKEAIICDLPCDAGADDFREVLNKIEDLAADASPIDLFNPHNHDGDAERLIGAMKSDMYDLYLRTSP